MNKAWTCGARIVVGTTLLSGGGEPGVALWCKPHPAPGDLFRFRSHRGRPDRAQDVEDSVDDQACHRSCTRL